MYIKRFDLVEPKEISFLSGQTIMFQVAAGVNRSMSIASAPSEKTSILVAHDVSPMGPYSQWTLAANKGDPMNFIGPLGAFTLDRESPRKAVFIATGTGVAPFRSMLLDQLAGPAGQALRSAYLSSRDGQGPDLHAVSGVVGVKAVTVAAKRYASPRLADSPRAALMQPLSLYWGLRREEDVFWKEEFEELAVKHPNFKFILTLSQASDRWQGKRGRVGEHVFIEEKNPADADFYLCGNRQMVAEMEAALLAKNVPKEQIKKELFY